MHYIFSSYKLYNEFVYNKSRLNVSEKFVVIVLCFIGGIIFIHYVMQLIKSFFVSYIISKVFQIDCKVVKETNFFFSTSQIPVKQIICLMIIIQKALCIALLLYILHMLDIYEIQHFFVWSKNGQILAYLSNGFASFYFLQGLIQGGGKTAIAVPLFCICSNLYIACSYNFWQEVAVPALIFAAFFVVCYIFFVHVINSDFEFDTPFMDKLSMYTERIGSYCLAGQLLEIMSLEVWTSKILIRPCWTIICTNFFVNVYYYPEQFIIKSIAQQYKVNECAICLQNFSYQENESDNCIHRQISKPIEKSEIDQQLSIANEKCQSHENQLCQMNKFITLTNCYHLFHSDCLVVWLAQDKNSCPICRSNLDQ